MLATALNWSQVISAITQLYLQDTTICLIWNPLVEFHLTTFNFREYYSVINIELNSLRKSFEQDIADFKILEKRLSDNNLRYNELTKKLTMAIEKSHCESFLVFHDHILPFIESFINASQYSVWRSKRNRFVFGYLEETFEENFVKHPFFEAQNSILLISEHTSSNEIFNIKTNKFNGPKSQQQYSLLFLDQFYTTNASFLYNHSLFPDKITNLKGREVIAAGFDYRPYFVINYVEKYNNSYDVAYEDSSLGAVQIDGTETHVLLVFCEIYNCTVWIDSSEATDWGEVYPNLTGDYSLGMVVNGKAEIAVGAMYSCCAHKFEANFIAEDNSWYASFKFGCATAIKLFLSQSNNSYVRSFTVRVLLFTCFMNDIILTSIYSGGLSSILTIPSYDKAADTIDGMLYHNLLWSANSEAWVSAIRYTDDDRMNGILQNFFIYNDDELEVLARTRSDMGFTVERLPFGHYAIGDYLSSQTIEHLKIMKEDLYFQYTVAFVKRNWPLLDRFDHLIYWWHSAGLDKYWEWRIVAINLNVQKQKQVEASMYSNMEDNGAVKLGMSNFVGILLIWVLGISISLVVFLYEVLEHYVKFMK
ncbi:hypothetical protein FF38_11380 [Lucilia cuprina]|uniref:Ionotropic glutamate receptor C-terminal domain-containing protein n=1 Tax=Lucilia cuprina TaxID=7375 RepID=A0A0L0C311_LUCCU|nr:hypothetical protein FF38_11380 [Lucilia cuprina]